MDAIRHGRGFPGPMGYSLHPELFGQGKILGETINDPLTTGFGEAHALSGSEGAQSVPPVLCSFRGPDRPPAPNLLAALTELAFWGHFEGFSDHSALHLVQTDNCHSE